MTAEQTMNPVDITVMILAAGKGKRMLPLTETTPKPLLKVGELALIEHHLVRLKDLGFQHVVINVAYLATKLQDTIGNGEKYGLSISYSDESESGALETAGGIRQALPLINSESFLVVNADIWTDFDFTKLLSPLTNNALGRLVLVANPDHNQKGDFVLNDKQQLSLVNNSIETKQQKSATFSGIAFYKKALFEGLSNEHLALAPVLREAITKNKLQGKFHGGEWQDIGTPERLQKINQQHLNNQS